MNNITTEQITEEKTNDLENAVSLVKKLEYPNEIIYYNELKTPSKLTIIDEHKNTKVENIPYSFLTHLSYPFRNKMKKLGIIIINIDELNACNTITSSFSLPVRIHSRRHDVPFSCYDYWTINKSDVIDIAKIQLDKHIDRYTSSQLPPNSAALENECAIALFKTGIPGCFPATLVTTLIDDLKSSDQFKTFANEKNTHMLDISAGWGDRLLAACSRSYNYTGCDPNTQLTSCYKKIIKSHGDPNKQKVICSPFEDWKPDEFASQPNCMISSPPFFNLEIYSDESTQSSERYRTIQEWIENFLKPSLKKASSILAPDSPVVLHLSDIINFKDKSKSIIFVESVIQWCVQKLNWRFIGNYGFTNLDCRKTTETEQERKEKDEVKLLPKGIVKKYENGLRTNNFGEVLSQPLWAFRT